MFLIAAAPASAAPPRVVPKSVRVVEGDTGTRTVRVVLALGRRAPARSSVRFRTRGATAGRSDFRARTGTVRFRRGSRRAVIAVAIRGDTLEERDERLSVRLSRPRGVRLGRARAATITIVDDDPLIATLADVTTTEPGAPEAVASHGLTIGLTRASRTEVRVDYELVAGGTTTAADVDLVRGTATFAPGETRKTLPGVVRGDALDEADETATVLLSNPVGARLPDTQATLTIADDPGDVPPSVSIGDATVSEGAGIATLPVTLSVPSGRAVTVAYATQDGTADGADRPPASGTLRIEPGATSAAIGVPVTDDPRDEDAQSFTVAITQPDGATLADGDATVTIEDDDAPPSVAVDDVTRQEADTVATFTLTLSAPSEKPISVRADTVPSTATPGASCGGGVDYISLSGLAVVFSPGITQRTVTVGVCGDGIVEAMAETAVLNLSQLVNVTAGDVSGVLTIVDDDG